MRKLKGFDMTIPKHDEIRLPVLRLLQNGAVMKVKEFEAPLAESFKLSADDLMTMYDSGNGPVFYDRITWALSFLSMSGLVHKPRRGHYQVTDLGLKCLKTPDKINDFIAEELKNRERPKAKKDELIPVDGHDGDRTPQETIDAAFAEVKLSIYNDILDTIISKSPREFEKLVVQLLQKMGYGGTVENSGLVTQYSNDHGIDGIIKEDILGFGRIHIQAKRYQRENSIGREDLNKFVGALAGTQSTKGVFITTSSFNSNARNYANGLNGITLILIDGVQLAQYIYDCSLGM
ncbi:MAG: restriction endonuclease, partial [Mariprofundaceae bacterium]